MIEVRLTEDLEAGATVTPRYSTEIVKQDGGGEVRNSRWTYPLHTMAFTLSPGVVDTEDDVVYDIENDLKEFRDLFYAAGGSADTFRFKDRYDFRGIGMLIGTGDGAETEFQLVKNYTRGAVTRRRKITRPVADTVVVYVNDVVSGTAVVDYDTGLVTFPGAPNIGAEIRADFLFDIPVRFADDEVEFVGLTGDLQQPVNITVEEVRE